MTNIVLRLSDAFQYPAGLTATLIIALITFFFFRMVGREFHDDNRPYVCWAVVGYGLGVLFAWEIGVWPAAPIGTLLGGASCLLFQMHKMEQAELEFTPRGYASRGVALNSILGALFWIVIIIILTINPSARGSFKQLLQLVMLAVASASVLGILSALTPLLARITVVWYQERTEK